MPSVVLRDGGWRIRILPLIGGGLGECAYRGQPILQPAPQQNHPSGATVALSYFPLVPFSNRILNSRFVFEGRTVLVRPNLPDYPHAMHGHGWQVEWQVLRAERSACTLHYEHAAADSWPWTYDVRQRFSITAHGFVIELTLRNRSPSRMPAGLGFHPFFPRPDSATLLAAAERVWQGAADQFPVGSTEIPPELDFTTPRSVRDVLGMDHCYSGWSGSALIEWRDAPYRVRLVAGPSLRHLLIYVPRNRDFFCVEPVSHAVNAFNLPVPRREPVHVLESGGELSATLTLHREPRLASVGDE